MNAHKQKLLDRMKYLIAKHQITKEGSDMCSICELWKTSPPGFFVCNLSVKNIEYMINSILKKESSL